MVGDAHRGGTSEVEGTGDAECKTGASEDADKEAVVEGAENDESVVLQMRASNASGVRGSGEIFVDNDINCVDDKPVVMFCDEDDVDVE